jgi:hypothetical protein
MENEEHFKLTLDTTEGLLKEQRVKGMVILCEASTVEIGLSGLFH